MLSKGIDPETIWPPLATTALPVVAASKCNSTTSFVFKNTCPGINWYPSASYALTNILSLSKLWVIEAVDALLNDAVTVAFWSTVIFVNAEPLPLKEPV